MTISKVVLICILFSISIVQATAKAKIDKEAAYLPERMMDMMPDLLDAIKLVAETHQGCVSIANASFSESRSTRTTNAFFVSCKMQGRSYPYQNVFVRNGSIIGTLP